MSDGNACIGPGADFQRGVLYAVAYAITHKDETGVKIAKGLAELLSLTTEEYGKVSGALSLEAKDFIEKSGLFAKDSEKGAVQ